ncbi:MAG: YeeE/YedE family protein [Paucibacter sp.]|nr:YeeE/YedE family protein [Roseateles sp.]
MSFPFNDGGAVSGLICGLLFGFVLERAGFGSPAKLTAQFRFTDWSVLKVMFTAIVVAAAGLALLRALGWLAADAVFVPSAFLGAAAIGGALVGAGFAVGGYCPGTSVVALMSGRLDALVFVLGLLLGTGLFAWAWGSGLEALTMAGELAAGDNLLDAFGIPDGWAVAGLGLALVFVYWLGGRMERNSRGPVSAAEAVAGAQSD